VIVDNKDLVKMRVMEVLQQKSYLKKNYLKKSYLKTKQGDLAKKQQHLGPSHPPHCNYEDDIYYVMEEQLMLTSLKTASLKMSLTRMSLMKMSLMKMSLMKMSLKREEY
jgi:hypothetical protein